MGNKVTIKISEDFSDWYRTIDKEIDTDNYTHFKLKARNLAWYLDMYQGNRMADSVQVETSPKVLLEKLHITEIIGNRYLKARDIMSIDTTLKALDQLPLASRMIPFPNKEAFLMKAKGNGMLPEIMNADMLLCTSNVKKVKDQDIVVLRKGKDIQCKYYNVVHNNVFYVSGDRRVIGSNRDFKVIGIVKQIIRDL